MKNQISFCREKHSYLELFTSQFLSFGSLIGSPRTCFIFPLFDCHMNPEEKRGGAISSDCK